jgi:general stress protein 26
LVCYGSQLTSCDEKEGGGQASLIFQNSSANFYVAINGTATVVDSSQKFAELWTPFMEEFFDGPSDPRIVCLGFEPLEAKFWTGPGRVSNGVKLFLAAATGIKSNMGTHGKVEF